jgi:hypothetical protein
MDGSLMISYAEAKNAGLKRYQTGKPCKHGHVDDRLTSNQTCCECNRLKVSQWQKLHPEKAAKNRANWRNRNPGLAAKRASDWYHDNIDQHKATMAAMFAEKPHLRAELSSIARAAKLKRTPKWLSKDEKWMIGEIYHLADVRTKATGIAWHVDHIIPLRGEFVSGLHTPYNLQVIPAIDNLRKSNRYDA